MTQLDIFQADRDVDVKGNAVAARTITIGQQVANDDLVVVDVPHARFTADGVVVMRKLGTDNLGTLSGAHTITLSSGTYDSKIIAANGDITLTLAAATATTYRLVLRSSDGSPVRYTWTNLLGAPTYVQTQLGVVVDIQYDGTTFHNLSPGVQAVANVAALFTLNPADGQTVRTLGYSTIGVGASSYRYVPTSTATVNGGSVLPGVGGVLSFTSDNSFNGTAGTGRFVNDQATSVDHWGAIGDDTVDDWGAFQRYVNAVKTLGGVIELHQDRVYRCTKTINADEAVGVSFIGSESCVHAWGYTSNDIVRPNLRYDPPTQTTEPLLTLSSTRGIRLAGIAFVTNSINATGSLVRMNQTDLVRDNYHIEIERCYFGSQFNNMRLESLLELHDSTVTEIRSSNFIGGRYGIHVSGFANNIVIGPINVFQLYNEHAIYVEGQAQSFVVRENVFEPSISARMSALHMAADEQYRMGVEFSNNWIGDDVNANDDTFSLTVRRAQGCIVTGNLFGSVGNAMSIEETIGFTAMANRIYGRIGIMARRGVSPSIGATFIGNTFQEAGMDANLTAGTAQSCVVSQQQDTFSTVGFHKLANTNAIVFSGTPPTGLTAGTVYYARDVTNKTFKVAATSGGTAIAFSTSGTSVVVAGPSLAVTPLVYASFFDTAGHTFVEGELVRFAGSVMPTGITAATDYYIVKPFATTFSVATTPYGQPIAFTTAGTSVTVARSYSVVAQQALFTATAHGFIDRTVVQLGGTPPSGLSTSTDYYVRDATANTFSLAATDMGHAIAYSDAGTSVTATEQGLITTTTLLGNYGI